MNIDAAVVVAYCTAALGVGVLGRRRFASASTEEFLTGARALNWKQAALSTIAMTVDPGIMGTTGLAFLWGLVIHWNAVNMWLCAPFAAFFLLPIYWRSGIVTTPEYLERRFGGASRVLVAVLMLAFNIVVLAALLHLGGLILSELFHWPVFVSTLAALLISGVYVVSGGMKAVLALNRYQSALVLVTIFAVAGAALYRVGGIAGFAAIRIVGEGGRVLPSTIPPTDWSPFSRQWFPVPAILCWAPLLSTAWLACNFSFVQCFLATRTLADAQKSMLALGTWSLIMSTLAYIAGVAMRRLAPGILPDTAFLRVIVTMFPTGVRGLLVTGLVASLLSAVNGILMASGTLATKDIYLKLVRPADDRNLKTIARTFQILAIAVVVALLPVAGRSRSITAFIQHFMGDVFGVIMAWFLVGAFSRRAAPRAAFLGAMAGTTVAVSLDIFTRINFAYVGFLSFAVTVAATLILSRREKPVSPEKLRDLTVYRVDRSEGPAASSSSWPGIWKWACGSLAVYLALSLIWEWYLRR
jgi:SSS family solute:Na+ symporter